MRFLSQVLRLSDRGGWRDDLAMYPIGRTTTGDGKIEAASLQAFALG